MMPSEMATAEENRIRAAYVRPEDGELVTPRTKLAEVKANVIPYVDKDPVSKARYIVTAFNAAGESEATNVVCISGTLGPGKTYTGRAK